MAYDARGRVYVLLTWNKPYEQFWIQYKAMRPVDVG